MALVAELARDHAFRLTIAATAESVREALIRIAASGPMAALDQDHRAAAEIVLAEALNNIVEHAYFTGPGDISIRLAGTSGGISCQIADHGREMPGRQLPRGTLPPDNLAEGGFGWYLIRSLTQGLDYRRRDGRNLLHFVLPA